ncbi:MAG: hypothetical protein NXH71_08490 [Erythrobacteraceae bacterium]|jgi:hypothetical protein|nr:hypothetical protein [Erythrobacteraceae bacterium]
MMTPLLDPAIVMAVTCLVGITVVAAALLRGWHGWLDLKRQELERGAPATTAATTAARSPDAEGSGIGTARIELADLKERIRKLEAIASGVEL